MKKSLKIVLCVIVALIILIFAFRKPIYNFAASKLFDYFVEKNINALIKDSDDPEKLEEIVLNNNKNEVSKKDNDKQPEDDNQNSKNKSKASANSPNNENNEDGVYKSKTHIGVLTDKDLTTVMSKISSSDKAKIITILRGCVSKEDYPHLAKLASDGLDGSDKAYIEGYLRSHLTPGAKKQILDIIKPYLGR